MFLDKEKKYLLGLARRSIRHYFDTGKVLKEDGGIPSEKLKEKLACFVTLTIGGQLRGCIGHILPVQELYKDVIENVVSAAFEDPRFYPLSKEEFDKIKIEISVLTVPVLLAFSTPEELIKKLRPKIDGVILKQGRQQATFLPQVWEELSNPKEFLGHLCLKAGLEEECWRGDLEVETYQAEAFGEQGIMNKELGIT
ncbi:MAG: AmmeMemoRadiSam system protein A, partial [Patescibacteria group bacterium]